MKRLSASAPWERGRLARTHRRRSPTCHLSLVTKKSLIYRAAKVIKKLHNQHKGGYALAVRSRPIYNINIV